MPMMHDFAAFLPELFLAFGAMSLLMIGVFIGEGSARRITFGALGVFIATFILIVVTPYSGTIDAFNGLVRVDAFGAFMKGLVLVGAGLTLILGYSFFEQEGIAKFEYPVVTVLSTLGMFFMISANDLMTLYVGLELQSLALYIIAASNRDDMRSTEAGLKYFVLGALSSGMLLYGSSMVYGFTGTTGFVGIAQALAAGEPSTGVIIGLVFVIAGLAFKVSAVPFHMWTPDVYEGSPTPVTAFFAVAPKVAAMGLLIRVLEGPFGGIIDQWRQIIVLIALASMLLGSFAAINQKNLKRLMAYSSIANMGYALVGIAAGGAAGVGGVMIFLATYVSMSLGTFGCILAMRRDGKQVESISDLSGLSRTNPGMAVALALLMFSMVGLPPLAGFFGKFYVFLAAIEAKLYTLAIIGVLSSVVAAFYYIRIIKVMYFDEPAGKFERMPGNVAVVTALSTVVTVLFFLWPGPLVTTATAAAGLLIGH